jgi:hypothetical protein
MQLPKYMICEFPDRNRNFFHFNAEKRGGINKIEVKAIPNSQ